MSLGLDRQVWWVTWHVPKKPYLCWTLWIQQNHSTFKSAFLNLPDQYIFDQHNSSRSQTIITAVSYVGFALPNWSRFQWNHFQIPLLNSKGKDLCLCTNLTSTRLTERWTKMTQNASRMEAKWLSALLCGRAHNGWALPPPRSQHRNHLPWTTVFPGYQESERKMLHTSKLGSSSK
jgi:hypothetical protein